MSTIRVAQGFMLTAPLSLLALVLLNAYKAQHNFSVVNKTNYLIPFLTLLLLVGLGFSSLMTPLGSSLAYRLPIVVITLWKLIEQWKYHKPKFQRLRSNYKKILSYSMRSAGINMFSQVAVRIDQAMVVTLLSPSAMGIYVVALSLSRMVAPFNRSILSVLFPKIAARPPREVIALTARAARISSFLTTVTVATAMVIAPFALTRLYGSEFAEGVYAFRILAMRMILEGTTMILAQAFMALDRPGIVTVLQGIGLGLTVPLMLILIPWLGMTGASYALLISTAIRLGFIMLCFPVLLKSPVPNIFLKLEDISFVRRTITAKAAAG